LCPPEETGKPCGFLEGFKEFGENFLAGLDATASGDLTESGPGWRTGVLASQVLLGLGVRTPWRGLVNASRYENITRGGSVTNRLTDVSSEDFVQNLVHGGWMRSVSRDGRATILQRQESRYVLRRSGEGVPTADFYRPGSTRPDLKIRLEGRKHD
jgi:hypothetical protein